MPLSIIIFCAPDDIQLFTSHATAQYERRITLPCKQRFGKFPYVFFNFYLLFSPLNATNVRSAISPSDRSQVSKMMSRADGLVQRRNVNRDNNDGVSRENGQSSDKLDYEEDIDDGDSKETRLTLMEEVLLLGLKDKEVFIYLHISPLNCLIYITYIVLPIQPVMTCMWEFPLHNFLDENHYQTHSCIFLRFIVPDKKLVKNWFIDKWPLNYFDNEIYCIPKIISCVM